MRSVGLRGSRFFSLSTTRPPSAASGGEREVGDGAGAVEVQDEIVGEAGGEDKRRAFQRKHHLGLQEAGDLVGIVRLERREDRLSEWRGGR